MRVLILEDELPAREQLDRAIRAWDPGVEVVGALGSVREAIAFLRTSPAPDLIVSDIQLSDGVALSIFEQVPEVAPVVFCTAYDGYLQDAMRLAGIDYLLKPLEVPRLHAALDKYLRLRTHFAGRLGDLADHVRRARTRPTRLLAHRGDDLVPLPVDQVAWFVSEDKVTVAVDRAGARHLLAESLATLETLVGTAEFFRANRQYLVRGSAVARLRPAAKGRLALVLSPPAPGDVTVSQEQAAAFRAWLRSG